MNDERPINKHKTTVHEIARAGQAVEMTSTVLGKTLEGRHHAVNYYPGGARTPGIRERSNSGAAIWKRPGKLHPWRSIGSVRVRSPRA